MNAPALPIGGNWNTGGGADWGQITRSLNCQSAAVITRRPELQADWVAVMDGQSASAETLNVAAHLASLSPERRAELEGEWK